MMWRMVFFGAAIALLPWTGLAQNSALSGQARNVGEVSEDLANQFKPQLDQIKVFTTNNNENLVDVIRYELDRIENLLNGFQPTITYNCVACWTPPSSSSGSSSSGSSSSGSSSSGSSSSGSSSGSSSSSGTSSSGDWDFPNTGSGSGDSGSGSGSGDCGGDGGSGSGDCGGV